MRTAGDGAPAGGAVALDDLLALSPAAAEEAVRQLGAARDGLESAAALVDGGRVDPGGWRGAAADVAVGALVRSVAGLREAADAFADAAGALTRHAGVVEGVRRDAAHLSATAAALGAGVGVGSVTAVAAAAAAAAAEERAAVAAAAASLREAVRQSSRATARAVDAVTARAPADPSGWAGAADGLQRHAGAFALGAAEGLRGLTGLLQTSVELSPTRALVDPDGWQEQRTSLLEGLVGAAGAAARDPLAAGWALVDGEMWEQDPTRAAGRLAPDVLLALVGAGGAGRVASATRTAAQGRAATASATAHALPSRLVPPRAARPWTSSGGLHLTARQDAVVVALRERAAAARPEIERRLARVGDALGVVDQSFDHSLKELESLRRKAATAIAQGDLGGVPAASLDDVVRHTLVLDHDGYAEGVFLVLAAMREQGRHLVGVRNYWIDATRGYQGLNTKWGSIRTGVQHELQLHTPASYAATTSTHSWYEVQRAVGAPPALVAEAVEAQARAWAAVPVPAGVEGLTRELTGLVAPGAGAWGAALCAPAAGLVAGGVVGSTGQAATAGAAPAPTERAPGPRPDRGRLAVVGRAGPSAGAVS